MPSSGEDVVNDNSAGDEVEQKDANNNAADVFGKSKLSNEKPTSSDKPSAEKGANAPKTTLKGRLLVPNGTVVEAENRKYEVTGLLGSGGFGDVYRIENMGDYERYAMKTEVLTVKKETLKLEVTILMDCTNAKDRDHFIKCIDKGRTTDFKFVVMELVGKCIDSIRKNVLQSNFTRSTAFQIGIQTLQAVKDFHKLGWLHRDIKGQNFAIGPNDRETIIYMLDFGIAKRFLDEKGKHIPSRNKVKFLGTLRWASRACHKGDEQGRKDDVEVWLYMLIDLFDDATLPWQYQKERKMIYLGKEALMKETVSDMYKNMPRGLSRVIRYVRELKFADEPDYDRIERMLRGIARDEKVDLDRKLDWVGIIGKIKLKRKPNRDRNQEGYYSEEWTQVDTGEGEARNAATPHSRRELRRLKLSKQEVDVMNKKFSQAIMAAVEMEAKEKEKEKKKKGGRTGGRRRTDGATVEDARTVESEDKPQTEEDAKKKKKPSRNTVGDQNTTGTEGGGGTKKKANRTQRKRGDGGTVVDDGGGGTVVGQSTMKTVVGEAQARTPVQGGASKEAPKKKKKTTLRR